MQKNKTVFPPNFFFKRLIHGESVVHSVSIISGRNSEWVGITNKINQYKFVVWLQ